MATTAFDRDGWWDEQGFLHGLNTLLGPVREPFMLDSLNAAGLGSGSRILDLGSGGGFVSEALSESGHDVIAVDPSVVALRDGAHRFQARFAAAGGEALPFPDGRFDAVVASEVLEHVDDAATVISEVGRVLSPGGLFLFSIPNRTWLSRLVLIELAQRFPPTRILPSDLHEWAKFIRPEELQVMARLRGLVVEEVHGLSIRARDVPQAVRALVALRRHRISYAEAGRMIEMRLSANTAVAYLGVARKVQTKPSG